MKKALVTTLLVCMIGLAVGAFLMKDKIASYLPSKEYADLETVLRVSGEQTAIFLNEYQMLDQGITRDGQTYLPISLVNSYLNEKFYWDDEEKMLVYTLPESIVYADKRTIGNNGKPLLISENDTVYLSADLVAGYTPMERWVYGQEENKRIYLDTLHQDRKMAEVVKKTQVRVLGGIKSPILTEVQKGDRVYLLDVMEEWARVRTSDGYTGYLKRNAIGDTLMEKAGEVIEVPEYTNISLGEPVCLIFHQVTLQAANKGIEKMIPTDAGINVVAPTWFSLNDSEGGYESFADRSYVDTLHSMGIQVWAVLENVNHPDQVNNKKLFSATSRRKKLIERLMGDVETYDLDGINLDIEGLKESVGPHYIQFIRELSVACRKNGTILSVDNYVPSSYTEFYNRSEQGRVADYILIMGYDEHYSGSEAGSVASYSFVKEGIEDTVSLVPKEKVINILPLYTRLWTIKNGKTTSKAIGMGAEEKWVSDNGVQTIWLKEERQYYGEKVTDEGTQKIWMEEKDSLTEKYALILENEIAGVGFWKLGLDKDSIWEILRKGDN